MTEKMIFQFGDVSLTLTPADVEAVLDKLDKVNQGREITSEEFATACLEHMTANAKLTRTVIHN